MNQCLRITFQTDEAKRYLPHVQKKAQLLSVEGTAHLTDQSNIRIIVCGLKESIESFVDFLHESAQKYRLQGVQVEPILKEKDFRGVFRVIE